MVGPGRGTVVPIALLGAVGAAVSFALAEDAADSRNRAAVGLTIGLYLAVSVLLCWSRPSNRIGWLMLSGAALWGLGEAAVAVGIHGLTQAPGSVPAAAWVGVMGTAARGMGWLILVLAVPLLFPDGQPPWPRRRWPQRLLVVATATFVLGCLVAPRPLETTLERFDSPTGLPLWLAPVADTIALTSVALILASLLVAVVGLLHRWRTGDQLRRQQLGWFGAAAAVPIVIIAIMASDVVRPWMFALAVVPLPVAIAVAVLQHRLYDISLALSRTLTWVLLSGAVALLYAVTIGGVGALVGQRGAPWLGYVAAGVVAVSFAPLHTALRGAATRLVLGQWSDPREVLASTGRRLQDAADAPALLATVVQETAEGLGMPALWITDAQGVRLAAHPPPLGVAGDVPPQPVPGPGTPNGSEVASSSSLTLHAYGREVGMLGWQGQLHRASQRQLLADLAGQIGAVVYSIGLVRSLQAARERLVRAREEERRHLRRDLHDGLGPELAALTMRVDTLRNRRHEPDLDLEEELVGLRTAIQTAVASVRRVVEGLRPPALDELGIGGALEQLVSALAGGPAIDVDVVELPPLSAATEVALYRVAQEALTNVLRHAGAGHVQVRLVDAGREIILTVTDDGVGGPMAREGGVGIESMRERADEVGGILGIETREGGGTTVRLTVPTAGPTSDREEVGR